MRYFLAVVDHGSVTKAAEALYIAQPSLSQSIRALEAKLGAELFDRSGRTMVPTPAGLAFAETARRILAEADDARERVRKVANLEAGRLTIAATSTLAVYPLAEPVHRLLRQHPGIQVYIYDSGTPVHLLTALRSGAVELGVMELPVHEASLTARPLGTEEIVLALPPAVAERLPDPVPADAVRDLAFGLVAPDALGTTRSSREMAALIGNVRVRCAHRQLLWELVMNGSVSTFVARRVGELMLPGVVLRSVDPPITREVGLVHRVGELSPAARALVELATGRSRPAR
jgi:DNA-binding transcriptional LysR family regulator